MPKQRKQVNTTRDVLRTSIKESLMVGVAGGAGTTVVNVTCDASGISNDQFFLCPLGLTAASLSSSAYSNGSANNVEKPHLRKLQAMALDFRLYRVLSGRMVWIPSVSTNTPGQITLSSSADPFDLVTATAIAYSGGASYKTFNLSAGKECSIALSVDSSWKKVSSILSCPMGPVFDGSGTATNVVVNVANLDSLCFSAIGYNVQGAPGAGGVGTIRIEYEVEFKGVLDAAANA